MLDPAITAHVRDSFARQGLMATLGAVIEVAGPGRVTVSADLGPQMTQQGGAAHAGVTFALADSAQGYAAMTLTPPGTDILTVEMKINLTAPAIGRRLVAVAEVVKPGRRLLVTRAEVLAEDEYGARRTVAVLLGTMIPVSSP